MADQPVIRDERTVAVENASYKLGFILLLFGLMVIVGVRALVLHQTLWEGMALVIVSSGVATFCQRKQRILPRRWPLVGMGVALFGAVVGVVVVVLAKRFFLHP